MAGQTSTREYTRAVNGAYAADWFTIPQLRQSGNSAQLVILAHTVATDKGSALSGDDGGARIALSEHPAKPLESWLRACQNWFQRRRGLWSNQLKSGGYLVFGFFVFLRCVARRLPCLVIVAVCWEGLVIFLA